MYGYQQSCNIPALRQKRSRVEGRVEVTVNTVVHVPLPLFLSAFWYPNSHCFGSGLRALVLTLIVGLDSLDNNFYIPRTIVWITELALALACRAFGSQFR